MTACQLCVLSAIVFGGALTLYWAAMQTNLISQLLRELVAIPSVNRMGRQDIPPSSQGMIEHLEAWLKRHGIPAEREEVPGGETNLLARIGKPGGRTIVFDAHTDTVPAEGWEDRAFQPRIENGLLYGRGSCDTKASMAAMLVALTAAARQKELPSGEVVFVATADEEYSRTGVNAFLASGIKADLAIVGEPTRLEPVVACKGAAHWDIVIPGRAAHSSRPAEGINAISRLSELLNAIDGYNATVAPGKQHSLVAPPTMTPTQVRAGSAPNVVPSSCTLHLDLRTMPADDPAVVLREAQAFLGERCSFPLDHQPASLWGGADLAVDHPLAQRCLRSCRAVLGENSDLQPRGVNYGCHASDYAGYGIPAVVLGPGDIKVAHGVDEYVELSAVESAARIYYDLMIQPW